MTPTYSEFTRLQQTGALLGIKPVQSSLENSERVALEAVQATARKVLSTGIAGDEAKQATATLSRLEQVSRLSQGDMNAVTLKAAIDLGMQFSQGQVQQVLGTMSTPLGAVVSVQNLTTSLDKTLEQPSPQHVKALIHATAGATASMGQLSKLLSEHAGQVGRLLARGSQTLGKVNSAFSVGFAAMDVAIAGQDVVRFWRDPHLKSFAKMGLGLVAASASVLSAVKLPSLGGKAVMIAALADAGKMAFDVDWGSAYQGMRTSVTALTQDQAARFKQELLQSRLPASGHPLNRHLIQIAPLQ